MYINLEKTLFILSLIFSTVIFGASNINFRDEYFESYKRGGAVQVSRPLVDVTVGDDFYYSTHSIFFEATLILSPATGPLTLYFTCTECDDTSLFSFPNGTSDIVFAGGDTCDDGDDLDDIIGFEGYDCSVGDTTALTGQENATFIFEVRVNQPAALNSDNHTFQLIYDFGGENGTTFTEIDLILDPLDTTTSTEQNSTKAGVENTLMVLVSNDGNKTYEADGNTCRINFNPEEGVESIIPVNDDNGLFANCGDGGDVSTIICGTTELQPGEELTGEINFKGSGKGNNIVISVECGNGPNKRDSITVGVTGSKGDGDDDLARTLGLAIGIPVGIILVGCFIVGVILVVMAFFAIVVVIAVVVGGQDMIRSWKDIIIPSGGGSGNGEWYNEGGDDNF